MTIEVTADYVTDPYPGEGPQRSNDIQLERDYTAAPPSDPREYDWVMNGENISIVPSQEAPSMNSDDWDFPFAHGVLELQDNYGAIFQLKKGNMAIHLVEKRLKKFCRDNLYEFQALLSPDGHPYENFKIGGKRSKTNLDKFHTTVEEHQKSLKKYGPLKTHKKKKAAIDPDVLNEYIEKNGPYMYHSTHPANVNSILENGLLPKEETGVYQFGPGGMQPELGSRPNHTYIGHEHVANQYFGPTLRVDLRKLDPNLINLDEDYAHFRRPRQLKHNPNEPELPGESDIEPWDSWEAERGWDKAKFNEIKSPYEYYKWPTLGEWAESHSHILDHPDWIRASLEYHGNLPSLAIKGGVPADAIDLHPHYENADFNSAEFAPPKDPLEWYKNQAPHAYGEGMEVNAAYEGIGEQIPDKLWKPDDFHGENWPHYPNQPDPTSDEKPPGPILCDHCGEPCKDWGSYLVHLDRAHNGVYDPQKPYQPVVDLDQTIPADWNTLPASDPTIERQSAAHDIQIVDHWNPEPSQPWLNLWGGEVEAHQAGLNDGYHGILNAYHGNRLIGSQTYSIVPHANIDLSAHGPYFYDHGPKSLRLHEAYIHPDYRYPNSNAWQKMMDAVKAKGLPTFVTDFTNDPLKQRFQQQYLAMVKIAAKPKPINAPIPFVYDIEIDDIRAGKPGQSHLDIKDRDKNRLTPNVVEGLYMPDGKIQFKTDSTMPYTIRHMVQLWYSLFPELEVKNIHKMVGDKKIKLAARSDEHIGQSVRNLAFTDSAAREVYNALNKFGNIYIVGGAIRDTVLGKIPKDIDLMVQGIPAHELEQLLGALPGRVDFTGKAFGVFRYKAPDGDEVEIALPRTEVSTGEGHKDFDVQADSNLDPMDDLARRDFTGNSMLVNMATGELSDPFYGAKDLQNGVLRVVNEKAFHDDPLRIMRAFSAMSRQGLEPEPDTLKAIRDNAYMLNSLPPERIQMELDKIFGGEDPERAVRMMRDTGVLHFIMPEVAATVDFDQRNKHHRKLLDEHLLDVLRRTQEQSGDPDLRMAALLHDIGKPSSYWEDEQGNGHFYKKVYIDPETKKPTGETIGSNHEDVGAEMSHSMLTDLKYPNARRDRIVHLVQHHMFPPFDDATGARKFIKRVGPEHAMDLLKLRRADQSGKGTDEWENKTPVNLQEQLVQKSFDEDSATQIKDLAIGGKDLIDEGMTPGPQFKYVLNKLLEAVIEHPEWNNRETLLPMAQNLYFNKQASRREIKIAHPNGQEIELANGTVWAYIEPTPTSVLVHLFQSNHEGQGNSMRALRELRSMFPGKQIEVTHTGILDAGSYWQKMQDRGLIDRFSNILDPIKTSLDPDVFDNPEADMPKVHPRIVHWVKKHIYAVLKDTGYPDPHKYLRLVLTGSLTTYQWSYTSDFDVSLWVDVNHFPEWQRADMISVMVDRMDGTTVPGTTHPIQCFVVDSNKVSMDDLYRPGLRSAYDLDRQKWIVMPEKGRVLDVHKAYPALIQYAKIIEDKMRMLLKYDPPLAKVYWDEIHHKRQRDMRAEKGDYAESNIAYKWLANSGLFPQIAESTGEYIAKTSLKSLFSKFITRIDKETYRNALRIHGPVKPHKRAKRRGAVTPEWWNKYISEEPYSYHVHVGNAQDEILQNGLLPHGQVPNQQREIGYGGVENYPRPNHAYVSDESNMYHPKDEGHYTIFKVDNSQLDPDKIDFDEDYVPKFFGYDRNEWKNRGGRGGFCDANSQYLTEHPEERPMYHKRDLVGWANNLAQKKNLIWDIGGVRFPIEFLSGVENGKIIKLRMKNQEGEWSPPLPYPVEDLENMVKKHMVKEMAPYSTDETFPVAPPHIPTRIVWPLSVRERAVYDLIGKPVWYQGHKGAVTAVDDGVGLVHMEFPGEPDLMRGGIELDSFLRDWQDGTVKTPLDDQLQEYAQNAPGVDHPSNVQNQIRHSGTFAIRGGIPAHALSVHESSYHDPSWMTEEEAENYDPGDGVFVK